MQHIHETFADMHAQFFLSDDSSVSGLGTIDIITDHVAPKVQNIDDTMKRTSPAYVHMELSCLAALVFCVTQMLSLL